uniref:Uncharacterized protein n=1 Tax=Anguilla anguilla TaxID=7936 RepID=A0A0E9QB21_ANGAN
MRSVMLVGTGC